MVVIKHGKLNCGECYSIRQLTINDLNEILAVQNKTLLNMENSSFLQPLKKVEYKHILNGNGLIIGSFIQQRLIAFRALLVPKIDEDHLGLHIGLKYEQLHKTIYQEITIVDELFRGNRLQQKLGEIVMQRLKQLDYKYNHVCATVAPLNIPSLLDKFRQNMFIKALKQVYEGKWRYIFHREIFNDKKEKWKVIKTISMSSYEEQIKLLNKGWIGFSLTRRQTDYFVLFGKPDQ